MKFSRPVLIAAIIISLIFTLSFIFLQILISRSVIILNDTNTILITPQLGDLDSTKISDELLQASQTPNLPGVFSTGMVVHIFQTGGDGLKIRSFAGFEGIPVYLGSEGEEFEITAGPEIVDSKIWWKIVSISNPQKSGWAVQEYLTQQ